MANTFAPFGFRPTRLRGGAVPNYAFPQLNDIAYNQSSQMFAGDPVLIDGSGEIDTFSPGAILFYGIFQWCEYIDSSLGRVRSPAWLAPSTAVAGSVKCAVITDPAQLFEVQVGGSTSVGVVTSNIGQNVQFAYGTGNTRNGISGAYIDLGTAPGATNTLPFRVVNLSDRVGNDNASPYNIIEVQLNYTLNTQQTALA